MSASRPSFVKTLLDRPLPELRPPKLSESNNPPWSKEVRAAIADGAYHPLLESAVRPTLQLKRKVALPDVSTDIPETATSDER